MKMEGTRLILKDNTVIENGTAGYSTGSVCLYFSGMTMREAADAMIENPEKTGKIIFQYGDQEEVYTGYTDCVNIGKNPDGEISVMLERK